MIFQKQTEIKQLLNNQLVLNGQYLCKQLTNLIKEYQTQIELYFQKIEKQKLSLEMILSDLSEGRFIQLDDIQIQEIISLDNNQLLKNQQQLLKPLENIDLQLNFLETIIKEYQINSISVKSIDLKERIYSVKQIDQAYRSYFASQISNNEKYLAYEGGSRDILKIYDIIQNKQVKEIKLDSLIHVCSFTFDSSQLYVSYGQGYVNGYHVQNNFNQIFRLLIHKGSVLNMRTIKNSYLITCSSDQTIRKTDVKRGKLIFKLIGHTQFINALDYNYANDMLLSGSGDRSIKLWDCKNKGIIINKQQAHQSRIVQIQFINNKQNILSLDDSSYLYKWRLDFINKDLLKLQKITDPYQIYTFCQINQNQNIILICGYHIKIINDKGDIINLIEHQAGSNFCFYESKQLDNAKYIHVRSARNILLLTRKNHVGNSLKLNYTILNLKYIKLSNFTIFYFNSVLYYLLYKEQINRIEIYFSFLISFTTLENHNQHLN
ncbi:hypothetical protein pb186bvf_018339 [Paramecium bursaria]